MPEVPNRSCVRNEAGGGLRPALGIVGVHLDVIGAIAGDVIGSIYERYPIKTKEFPLFDWRCHFTDDTVLTIAVADVLLNGGSYGDVFRNYYWRYPHAGYGAAFQSWARSPDPEPYNSFGNGSAMRVSPVAFALDHIEQVRSEASRSARVTHNHLEGIKGAEATASAVFLARRKASKNEIRLYIENEFGYDLRCSPDEIRPDYKFDVTCQGTVPAAISSFLHAEDFEDAIRNAISLGGDSDTLGCISGSIAGAYYGVPRYIEQEVRSRLDDRLRSVAEKFEDQFSC
jgi:ADP-ribosylglycohydrolase